MTGSTVHTAYLALGSNLGDKKRNLLTALTFIAERTGTFSAVSSVYETEPWGFRSENTFLNQAVAVETLLTPIELMNVTQEIEKEMGRTKTNKRDYEDRIIDIDLIFYDNLIYKSETLELPHPLLHLRQFVLEPLNEICPDFMHPVFRKKIKEIFHCREK
ncbi:MAG: 2-amino-4-hydroxy-6-hydroxymethyldihydropteridine diphosphokinase [Candidatus Symbiothrix sp.]|jgi:2-amino-4-hydroxy-6-hydroxymethyldihydropteridine diphosphokinase|nr:2-amino-4-hydroxy-6-hydroxymethyldihydropteridine diphosphokinase [Candidatus Symbiothrix sp.]